MGTGATGPLVEPGRTPLLYLDANVLLPEYLRAVFLDLADAGLVRVHWSEKVLAEVRRNLLQPHFGIAPAVVDRLFRDMAAAFPDAIVRGSDPLEPLFENRTDPKDAHVAAGALKLSESAPADQPVLLVTSNIRHLPESAFAGTAVRPARPGAVLKDLLAARPEVTNVLDAMLKRFANQRVTRADLLDILDASNCRAFATALGKAWGMTPET